jgi:hypothetical protein
MDDKEAAQQEAATADEHKRLAKVISYKERYHGTRHFRRLHRVWVVRTGLSGRSYQRG